VLNSARDLSNAGSLARVQVPPHDITGARPPNHARIPTLAPFRPQAFAASRRFSPRSDSEACFILEPCTGTASPSRGFSLHACVLSRREALPPCRWRTGSSRDLAAASPEPIRLDFEALLRAEKRSRHSGDQPNGGRSPPRVHVSSRHSTPRHALRFTRDASARDVPAVGLRLRDLRRPAPPAYCPPRSRAVLSPDPPTCSRF